MKRPPKAPQEAQKNPPNPRLKVLDNLAKIEKLQKLLLSRVGVSDNTAENSRNFIIHRVLHVQNSKNPHAILAAKPPIFGAFFSSSGGVERALS